MASTVKMVLFVLFGSRSSPFVELNHLKKAKAICGFRSYCNNIDIHFAIVNANLNKEKLKEDVRFNLSKVSNQTMLSDNSAIFDPLGLVTPPIGMAGDVTTPVFQFEQVTL